MWPPLANGQSGFLRRVVAGDEYIKQNNKEIVLGVAVCIHVRGSLYTFLS